MKRDKVWTIYVIASVILFLLLISAINIRINTFGVFSFDTSNMYVNDLNTRYTKIEKLLNQRTKYTSFLVGGSRVGTIKPSSIENYLSDERFYNLTVSSASSNENYQHTKFLVETLDAKTILLLIGIDQMCSSEQLLARTNRLHYKVSGENPIPFYLNYLTMVDLSSLIKFEDDSLETVLRKRVYNEDGTWKYQLLENKITENGSRYYQERKEFELVNKRTLGGGAIQSTVEYIRKIKTICDSHKTKLFVVITPHNHIMMDAFVRDNYLDFLFRISEVTDYWDFSGYNSVTINNENYYEHSHFRPQVGDLIVNKIFSGDSDNIPKDFGIYINKNNISNHMTNLKKEIDFWDSSKKLIIEK